MFEFSCFKQINSNNHVKTLNEYGITTVIASSDENSFKNNAIFHHKKNCRKFEERLNTYIPAKLPSFYYSNYDQTTGKGYIRSVWVCEGEYLQALLQECQVNNLQSTAELNIALIILDLDLRNKTDVSFF